jgi:hypothetical protein
MVTNTELTIDMITEEALLVLENKMALGNRCLRQFDKSFGNKGAEIGDTLRVRVPARTQTATGQAFVQQPFIETYRPVAAQTQRQAGVSFGSAEMALAINDFSEQYIKPAMVQMASDIDTDGTLVATSGYTVVNNEYVTANYAGTYAGFEWLATPGALVNGNQPANWTGAQIGSGTVGAAGATPQANASAPFFNAQALLTNAGAPAGERYCVINPQATATVVPNLFTLFNPQGRVSEMFEDGSLGGMFAGAEFFESPSVQSFTSGNWNAVGVTVSANVAANATAIALANVGNNAVINSGDRFVVPNSFAVNPLTRQSTGQLQTYVVVGSATANATGAVTVNVFPAIANSGPYQTVTALPASGNTATFLGTSATSTKANFYYHKDAIALVVAPLKKDLAGARVSTETSRADDEAGGLSIRYVEQYNASTDQSIQRFDVLYGWATVRPELGSLVMG